MIADSHCHINADDFMIDREDVVARARSAGVKYIVDVCDDIAKTDEIIAFCRQHENIYTTVGVHPELAEKYPDFSSMDLIERSQSPYVIGIGECGLDYYYNRETKDQQIKILLQHIDAAQKTGLPLIIHNRDSDEDMMEILGTAYRQHKFTGELHCFSSSEKLCSFALELGFYISASGIITFKKSQELRDIFSRVPLDRLLVETDSPFLAPEPYRGRRNEPAYVVQTAQKLAEIKHISTEKLTQTVTENFFRLFAKVNQNG
ncbi:MAG: TatD family hydrolase [Alphaproteobacteria bacterium]|nr:TatD family hydrolase [Alphaproteobacteria bacterium]